MEKEKKKRFFPRNRKRNEGLGNSSWGLLPYRDRVSVSKRIKCVFALLRSGQNSFHTSSQLTKTQRFKPGRGGDG